MLVVSAVSGFAQGEVPPLPRLSLDLFPAAARDAVSDAYGDAGARPTDPDAAGRLADLLHAWEQWEAAHAAYSRAQWLAPDVFQWHYLDGVVLQRLARHAAAAERFQRALAIAPGHLPALVKLADALLDSGNIDESEPLFRELAGSAATEPMGLFGLGRIAAAQGRHEVAVEHLQTAVNRFPQWGAAHYALALAYRALGRSGDAQRALERHAEHGATWPTLADPVLARVRTLRGDAIATLQRGLRLARDGDVTGAIAAHEAALALDPAYAQAHANLISLYGRIGDWPRAEERYRAVVGLGYNLDDAHYDFGVLLGLQERWEAAAEAYRKAIAVNPLHARAHNNLGQILERQSMRAAAHDAYRRAVASQPLLRVARFNLARTLVAQGQTSEAVVELEKLTHPPDAEAPRYLFALAGAYLALGRRAEAVKWATEARRLAIEHGQMDLAQAIERDLARVK